METVSNSESLKGVVQDKENMAIGSHMRACFFRIRLREHVKTALTLKSMRFSAAPQPEHVNLALRS